MHKYLLIDIGGTSIKVATYVDSLSEVKEYPTEAKLGVDHLIQNVMKIIDEHNDIEAISISTAGQVDAINGYIIYANDNLPGYTGTKWKELLENKYQVPVFVENDVNAAALGEGTYGACIDIDNFLALTYGTGVGGAIVINNELYRGYNGSAGEFGALITHLDSRLEGKAYSGSYEENASTSALVKKALEYDETLVNGREIFKRINEKEISEIVDAWTFEIVVGLASLIHIFNPKAVVLGGGIMEQDYVF